MPSLRNIFLGFVASAAVAQAEHLRVVWGAGHYSTITPDGDPQGSTGHDSKFAIYRDDGEAIYTESYPYGYIPCRYSPRTFAIAGDCWDSEFRFKCQSDFGGNPESCEVQDSNGNTIDSGTGQTDTDFIGIAIGIDATCVAEFESDGGGCPVDNGNGPLHAQGESV